MNIVKDRFNELNQEEITKCNQEYYDLQRKLSEENKKRYSIDNL